MRPQTVYLGDNIALTRIHSRHKIYVDTRDTGIASHLLLDGIWESWVESALMPEVKPGMTFCDIGANFGYYTLLGANAVGAAGRVYSFECNPRLFKLLKRSVLVNGLGEIVTPQQYAVSDKRGSAVLTSEIEFSGGGTLLAVGGASEWTREQFDVLCAPLDELVPATARVNIMKIDVEGAEPLVMAGAERIFSSPDLRAVMCEFYPHSIARTQPPLAFLERLSSYGFSLQVLNQSGPQRAMPPRETLAAIGDSSVYVFARR